MHSRFLALSCVAMLLLAQTSLSIPATPNPPLPAGVAGRYAVPDDQGFIDLRADGTFTLSHETTNSSGTYTVTGDAVTLVIPGATLPPLHFANGTLTIGPGVKMARVGEANPPPAPGASTGPAVASNDQVNTTRSILNVRSLYTACKLWAADHQGSFPDTLEQLLTAKYAGTDPKLIHCPLLHNDTQPGYVYLGKGLKDTVAGHTVLILSKWSDPSGKRIVGHADGATLVEIPKAADFPATVKMTIPSKNPAGAAATTPPPPGNGPGAGTAPEPPRRGSLNHATTMPVKGAPPTAPNTVHITLTATTNPSGVTFPAEQMPANPLGYYWVIERDDRKPHDAPLRQNSWVVNERKPGSFKMHVEYRYNEIHQTVSNEVQFSVPGSKN
jgi:hypothetical protein